MAFEIYIKKDVGNQISNILGIGLKKFEVATLDINFGLLKKGNYQIPIEHILFVKEV